MWRNEVNMRQRERARQQAEELRKMQKLFLLKAMSSPGEQDTYVLDHILLIYLLQVKWLLSSQICVVMDRLDRTKPPQDFTLQPANSQEYCK